MEKNKLNISWCYPDMLNLHGDRGNVMALKKVGELLGLDVNINKVETYGTKIDFENTDILLFNVGELKLCQKLIDVLNTQETEFRNYIESGKMIIAIGTTGTIFGKEINRADGTKIEGFGFFDMSCTEREMVYGNDIIFKLQEDPSIEIVGNQIQMIDIKLNDASSALGNVEYGWGNDGSDQKLEGAKYKNLIFTNALGPVLVKNPWYTEKLIKDAMYVKGIELQNSVNNEEYELERNSMKAIKEYTKNKVNM